jgi:DNA-binding NarL/FixJ family response regulator
VDDNELARSGFGMVFEAESDIEVVGEASDGIEAIEMVELLRPDVVLMDVRMPRLDGIESARRIAALALERPPGVLLVSAFQAEYAKKAQAVGASGFLTKDAPADVLIAAVRGASESMPSP